MLHLASLIPSGARSVYWSTPHPGTRCVFRGYPIENRIEPWRRCTIPRQGRGKRPQPHRERIEMLRETGMAEVNGARIYYEVAGEGDPLVLVHAGIADSRMWEDQLMAFADRYRVIRHDMRGFGMTAMVEGPFSHHEDLRALLDSPRQWNEILAAEEAGDLERVSELEVRSGSTAPGDPPKTLTPPPGIWFV